MKEKNTDWQSLSKKERRKLKKELRHREKEKAVKKKQLKKWGIILAAALFLAGGFFGFNSLKAKRYEKTPQIQLRSETYDFGQILAVDGKVQTTFGIENIGAQPLIITGMETSCGCTTAVLEKNGQRSPVFSMHNNPQNWSTAIGPGMITNLVVTFDPNFHQNTFGSVTRTISIFSNDPWKSEARVVIYANIKKRR